MTGPVTWLDVSPGKLLRPSISAVADPFGVVLAIARMTREMITATAATPAPTMMARRLRLAFPYARLTSASFAAVVAARCCLAVRSSAAAGGDLGLRRRFAPLSGVFAWSGVPGLGIRVRSFAAVSWAVACLLLRAGMECGGHAGA